MKASEKLFLLIIVLLIVLSGSAQKNMRPFVHGGRVHYADTPSLRDSIRVSYFSPWSYNGFSDPSVLYPPGNSELLAMQKTDSSITIEMLNNGYAVYTGPCTNCHGAKDVRMFSLESWPHIIDDMSEGANITDAEKDALSKYIFSVLASDTTKAK